ncbi:MAG: hypothetical protein ABJF23_04335 [Bryobacteraceae bacterium]
MSTTIDQYREAKNNYLKLRNQAKKELIARFNEIATELLQLQRELLEDFGEKIALPTKSTKLKSSKPKPAAVKTEAAPAPSAPSPKIALLEKQIEKLKKKLAETQAAGKPVKVMEDRIYELEDDLRLLKEK